MIFIKTLVTGLVTVSLCIATITGKVTDTSGVTPIAGAVVELEKGGQKATSGADGSFTLSVGSTGTLTGITSLPSNSLSARISGNFVTMSIAKKSEVEIAVFDFRGKPVLKVHKTLDAGNQRIALPQRSTGIYVYKITSGNSQIVFKGNDIGGATLGNSSHGYVSSQSQLSKRASITTTIDDVISSKKDGYLNYHCFFRNPDTSGVVIKMIANAGNVVDADNNVYQTVKIGNQIWTTENLRTTKYNDGTAIMKMADSASWHNNYSDDIKTPAYCFYKNITNTDSLKKFGALYNWYVVDTKKLAPAGWHVPSDAEWDTLQNFLIANGYNADGSTVENKIAKSLATKTDWDTCCKVIGAISLNLPLNNSSGFSALPAGLRYSGGFFNYQCCYTYFWSTSDSTGSFAYSRNLYSPVRTFDRKVEYKYSGFSVRLVKD